MYVYTLGYEGLQPDLYIKTLIDAGVKLVVDVRDNPWSQRPAYIGANLKRSLAEVEIQYAHWKTLGNPARIRKTARSAAQCLERYRAYLREDANALTLLVKEIRSMERQDITLCLTCYEHDPNSCHRSVIVNELMTRESDVQPIHLQPERPTQHDRRQLHSLTATAFLSPAWLPFTFE